MKTNDAQVDAKVMRNFSINAKIYKMMQNYKLMQKCNKIEANDAQVEAKIYKIDAKFCQLTQNLFNCETEAFKLIFLFLTALNTLNWNLIHQKTKSEL
jgi:uncharacterized protein YfcZ (UPF0381/DUF406 family)